MFDSLIDLSNYHFNPHALPPMLVSMLILIIGLFIFFQVKKTAKNVGFLLLCASLFLWLFGTGIVYLADNPQTALLWYKYFTFFGVASIMPNAYFFSAASSGVLKKQKKFVAASFILSFVFYLLAAATDRFITSPRLYFWGYYPHYQPTNFLFLIFYLITFTAVQCNLWFNYRRETIPIKKAQTLTIIIGFFTGFIASYDFIPKIWHVSLYPFGFLPIFIFTCLLAYSVIRHKAFDIETVIHKTAGWILASSTAFIPIMILAYWLKPWYRKAPAIEVALFCVGVFYLLTLYIRYTQPKIDHIFQRRKYNLEDISAKFTEDLIHLKGLNQLIQRIEGVISDTLYSQNIDIFIYDKNRGSFILANSEDGKRGLPKLDKGDKFLQWFCQNNKIIYREFVYIDPGYASIREAAKNYFKLTDALVVVPLVLNDELLGVINLDKKTNLKRYSALDFNFLTTLKNQSAIAISNSLLYDNMEEQVRQRTKELMAVQKQLVQAEKLATVGTLAGGVAHEINNPLTAVLTNVQMMLMDCEDDGNPDKESLELIEEATKRCRKIVQKLMVYARKPMETTGISNVDLKKSLEGVITFLSYQLEQENIKIIPEVKEGNYIVKGTHNEFEQVLTNLILNAKDAIKKIKKGGNIRITLSKNKDWIKLEVEDEGAGIADEIVSKIFDPFFTTKDVGKGLGLGLSICQAIVEKHNGTISARSVADSGSVFTVKLPTVEVSVVSRS